MTGQYQILYCSRLRSWVCQITKFQSKPNKQIMNIIHQQYHVLFSTICPLFFFRRYMSSRHQILQMSSENNSTHRFMHTSLPINLRLLNTDGCTFHFSYLTKQCFDQARRHPGLWSKSLCSLQAISVAFI